MWATYTGIGLYNISLYQLKKGREVGWWWRMVGGGGGWGVGGGYSLYKQGHNSTCIQEISQVILHASAVSLLCQAIAPLDLQQLPQ